MRTLELSKAKSKAIIIERHVQNLLDKLNDPFTGPTERERLSRIIALDVDEMCKLVP